MKTIAIVEDDVYIGDMVEKLLTNEGYAVLRAYSGTEALLLFGQKKPDLVLMDLMLPGATGEELLPKLKGIPVIVVSAKAGVEDIVSLLMDGAVDYITKPFDTRELLARITVALRKSESQGESIRLSHREIVMDLEKHSVEAKGVAVRLTRTEYAILKNLLRNAGQVVTKTALLERISLETPDCVENSLKVHVSNLRRKLKEASGEEYIESVWGVGFTIS